MTTTTASPDPSATRKPALRAKLPDGRELVITPPEQVQVGELTSTYSAVFIGADGQASAPQTASLHQIYDGSMAFELEDRSFAYFARKRPNLGNLSASFRTTPDAPPVTMTVLESEYDHLHVG